ncbi:efflux RND transporter periplasmic adaptor subunit [Spirosoma harenae]
MLKFFKLSHLILLLGLLSSTLACKKQEAEQKGDDHTHEHKQTDLVELSDDQLRIASIQLGSVSYRNLSHSVQLNGRLAVPAQSQVIITALQGGFIRAIPLLPGQPVHQGQVLARIENPELVQLQQEYAESHSRLTYLEAEQVRQQELSRENVSALKVLQQTTSELKATQARVTGLNQRIRLVGLSPKAALEGKYSASYVITAPQSGVVTDVLASTGQYVQPADMIAKLTSNQGLYAELTVFEKDLPMIREGQQVSLLLNNEGGRERSGRINYINRAIDTDRSVRVVAKIDKPDAQLTPNTFLKAKLNLGNSRVTALPEEAIVSAEGKEYIFIVTTEKAPEHHEHEEAHTTVFKQILVRRGVTENGYSQVTLPGNIDWQKTQVAVKGAYEILSQLKAAGGEEDEHGH